MNARDSRRTTSRDVGVIKETDNRGQQWRRRHLSQNFLSSDAVVKRFVDVAGVTADDTVVEIGPGSGAITAILSQRAAAVVAYEVDVTRRDHLHRRFGRDDKVAFHYVDITTAKRLPDRFKVVANIPFGQTAKIVEWLFTQRGLQTATLITQLEYARKRTGHGDRWSKRTILSWPNYSWELVGRISRREFTPAPSVDAGILHIESRPTSLIDPRHLTEYEHIVEIGFRGNGGTLYKSLLEGYSRSTVDRAFHHAGIDRSTVVAFVPPDAWLVLAEALVIDRRSPARQLRDRPPARAVRPGQRRRPD